METKYHFAKQIILEAGEFLRDHLDDPLVIDEKTNPQDLVTHLDKQVQDQLSQKILSEFPMDSVFGEEGGQTGSIKEGKVWVLDPIDGTTNFIAQKNDFSILLAYFEDGVGQFAIIYDVMQDKLFHGGGQFPVYLNHQQLEIPTAASLKRSLIGLNATLYATNQYGLGDLANHSLGTRSVGSAGIGFSHVLEGRLLAYASNLYPWDYAAASILGEGLDCQLLSLEGDAPQFSGREHVMLVPKASLSEIKRFIH